VSPLLGAPYEDRDLDLVRFQPTPIDDQISMVVVRSSVASDDELDRMRAEMDADDVALLDIFATRRSVAAWRSNSISLALEALDATILPPGMSRSPNHDFRFVLYMANMVGVSDTEVDARIEKTTKNARTALERALDSIGRATDMSQIGYVEVKTSHGLGVLHLSRSQAQTDAQWLIGASIIHSGSPIVHSSVDDIAPSVNLASLAVDIADAVDVTGVPTGPINVASLAAQWFSESPSASFVPTHGCLNFSVATNGVDDGYIDIFVAELPEDIDPSELAQLATSNDLLDERIVATSRGAVLVVMCPAPFDSDDSIEFPEDSGDDADVDLDTDTGADDEVSSAVDTASGPTLADLLAIAEVVLKREVTVP
jgi:hypothetical protein